MKWPDLKGLLDDCCIGVNVSDSTIGFQQACVHETLCRCQMKGLIYQDNEMKTNTINQQIKLINARKLPHPHSTSLFVPNKNL